MVKIGLMRGGYPLKDIRGCTLKKAPKIASKNQLQSARINFSGVVFILTENGQIDSTTLGFYLQDAKKIRLIASSLPFSNRI